MNPHDTDHNQYQLHEITGPEVREKATSTFLNLSSLAVRERAVTLFLLIAVLGAGIVAFFGLGRAEDPTFTVKVFTVAAVWPGATAQEMQDLVAEPLEKRMQELRDYDRVETFTRPGLALMKVSLKDSMNPKDVPEEFYQARKKLGDEAHKLPQGAYGPFINDEYSDVTFALYSVEAHGLPLRILTREAEALRQRLLHVPGVKKIDIVGEQPERIFVEFSYSRLANLGVSPQQIFDALTRENAVTPSGSIDTHDQQVFIRLDGALNDLQKIRDTPIVAGGRTLSLSDVAEVKRGYEDPATFMIRHNGENALLLSIVMREGWNGLDLGKALEAEQKSIANALPAGFAFSKVTDQAVNITEAYDEFMLKFCVALAVVMIVSLISLGWRVGIVVAAAVPVTLAITFVIMLATGRVFDRITLGALILGLGLLVDDAIISIEIMVVKMEEGWDRIRAAGYAWSHTAAPMLSGTIVTVVGLMPVGFAKSTAGEYAGNIFWVVAFALLTSWVVAVTFTPYLGVKLLPSLEPIPGGHAAIYATPGYQKLRRMVKWAVHRKFLVAGSVVVIFLMAFVGMGSVRQQFFPASDRPELLVEVTLPQGSSIETTNQASAKVETWLRRQPEAKIVTAYIGAGAPRFFLSYNPELPNPNFAKIIILTPSEKDRETLKMRLRQQVAAGIAPEARVRVTQLVFGPYTPWPVEFRIMGPDIGKVRGIAEQARQIMVANPHTRLVNADWGEKAPTVHFVLDQDRLHLLGLTPSEAGVQIQFLLTGVPVTQVREDIRTVDLVARSAGGDRFDPSRLQDMTIISHDGKLVPISQIGHVEVRQEEPILKRRDRTPTITLSSDIDEAFQPPQVSAEIMQSLQPLIKSLPAGYKIEVGGNVEEATKANVALQVVFPMMIILMLIVIMLQVRSFSAMFMVVLTAPLGLAGTVPILLLFHQPFGFNAILGLIALAGIIMRNTLILIGQIKTNQEEGLDNYDAVIEATVQRARPVLLTALAAVLAFIPLTYSVFWGSMAYTLIGGTMIGTVLTLLFLPALYAIWYGVKPAPVPAGKGEVVLAEA
ncbi:efflux RND transporter permease subunit [Granulicella sibirica]|uniref:RND efflux transporter n=1 Tax=Granulicella sibirica TaxID=2479048 RepID=A0A4Q0T1W3_9BACT|nr:efflux RND transporter permease subunit [Granulicella sibirica]RXH57167.1 RND efflux transporter [Granulicella sibirica]